MALITKPNTFSAGATIVAAEHNSNFDTIYSEFNGSISAANIDPSANIADTQLAQITTANKVSLTALTAAGSYAPSGAWSPSGAWVYTGTIDMTASPLLGASPIIFEGATPDDFETTVAVTDPTVDRTLTVPDEDINLGEQCIKGWAVFDGQSGTIKDSFNVTSVVRDGEGLYTITWDTDFASANYAIMGTAQTLSSDPRDVSTISQAAGSFQVEVTNSGVNPADADFVSVSAIGNQ